MEQHVEVAGTMEEVLVLLAVSTIDWRSCTAFLNTDFRVGVAALRAIERHPVNEPATIHLIIANVVRVPLTTQKAPRIDNQN